MFTAPLVAIVALSLCPTPIAPALVVGAADQWGAVAAVARVSSGSVGPVATAVCIGLRGKEAFLLTAAHVVPFGSGRLFTFYTRSTYPVAAWSVVGGEVVWRSPEADVALVKILLTDQQPGVTPLAPAFDHPKRFPVRLWAIGCPDAATPICRDETVVGRSLVARPENEAAFFWQTDRAAIGGMSGGPLLDSQRRVVGICAAASGGGGYYAHHDEILAGLKSAGYGWLIPTK